MIISIKEIEPQCTATCAWRAKHLETGGPIKQSDAPIIQTTLKKDWQLLGNEKEMSLRQRKDRETEGEKEGIVSGSADALWDFSLVLCAAIVHQSLLEAKSVRTE